MEVDPLHWAVVKGQNNIASYLIQQTRERLIPLTQHNDKDKTAEQLAAVTPLASLFTATLPSTTNDVAISIPKVQCWVCNFLCRKII